MGNTESGFGSSSTAAEVVAGKDLKNKTVLITGGNTGIGKETAIALASVGAEVYVAGRDEKRTLAAIEDIKKVSSNNNVHFLQCDLSSLESVRGCAAKFNAEGKPLNILINNAGIMAPPFTKTKDGFEIQFGTNHLGHFLLTQLLLDRLKEGAPARVVNVSSKAHTRGHVDFDNLDYHVPDSYTPFDSYGRSKLCNILHANEFNRRYAESCKITANSLHPGVIPTELGRNNTLSQIFYTLANIFLKSIEQGAATTCYVATSSNLEGVGGKYFADSNEATPIPEATNPEVAKKLWEVSEQLTSHPSS